MKYCVFDEHHSTTPLLHHSVFFLDLGPNGSGWNGPSRICKYSRIPWFARASSRGLRNSSRSMMCAGADI